MAAGPAPRRQLRQASKFKRPQRPPTNDAALASMEAALPLSNGTASLLVIGLPRHVRPGKVRRPLRDFLKEFGRVPDFAKLYRKIGYPAHGK